MNFEQMIRQVSPDIYENLKEAVELGRWPDGSRLTEQQKKDSMELVLGYNLMHFEEKDRIGYIDKSCPSKERDICETNAQAEPVKFIDRSHS
jgi:uncharacterized protein YeaC (DUF1315 family)